MRGEESRGEQRRGEETYITSDGDFIGSWIIQFGMTSFDAEARVLHHTYVARLLRNARVLRNTRRRRVAISNCVTIGI